MGFLKHDWPFLLPCDLCTVCANSYAFGRVCLCVCATKKHPFTGQYLHENSVCHSLTLCMSPNMFARSTESHREHYSQHFYSCDSPLPRVTGSSVMVNSPLTVLSEHEYVFCGTLVYTVSNGWVEMRLTHVTLWDIDCVCLYSLDWTTGLDYWTGLLD